VSLKNLSVSGVGGFKYSSHMSLNHYVSSLHVFYLVIIEFDVGNIKFDIVNTEFNVVNVEFSLRSFGLNLNIVLTCP